jgi:hypothetical protein
MRNWSISASALAHRPEHLVERLLPLLRETAQAMRPLL